MKSTQDRLLNMDGLTEMEQEIRRLPDRKEAARRQRHLDRLYERLMELYAEYDCHIQKYNLRHSRERLIAKGLTIYTLPKGLAASLWERCFDSLVTPLQKARTPYYSDQFRWHLFSFGLLPALSGNDARKAFDSQKKGSVYLLFQHKGKAYHLKNAKCLKAADLDLFEEYCDFRDMDLYLFSPDGSWAYCLTHEEQCGPYFYRRDP